MHHVSRLVRGISTIVGNLNAFTGFGRPAAKADVPGCPVIQGGYVPRIQSSNFKFSAV